MNPTLHAILRPVARLQGYLRLPTGSGQESIGEYSGTYSVIPSEEEQILPTAGKKMTADLTVLAIPFREYENEAGGITIIIGGE